MGMSSFILPNQCGGGFGGLVSSAEPGDGFQLGEDMRSSAFYGRQNSYCRKYLHVFSWILVSMTRSTYSR